MIDRDLIFAAAKLARHAPGQWEEFLGALAKHTDLYVSNCISSPLDALAQNQGRAQSMTALLIGLREAVKTADQIERKSKQ